MICPPHKKAHGAFRFAKKVFADAAEQKTPGAPAKSVVVPGGGKRERERRLRRLTKERA